MKFPLPLGKKAPFAVVILSCSLVNATSSLNSTVFNATGSTTFLAARLNDTLPEFSWKLSNLISESPNPDAPHVSRVIHTFEIQTSPYQDFASPSYPTTGCVFYLHTFPSSIATATQDDGTCSSVLSPPCLTSLSTVLTSILTSTLSTSTNLTESTCLSLQTSLKAMVRQESSAYAGLWSGQSPFTVLDSTAGRVGIIGVEMSNETALYTTGWTTFSDTEGEYTAYDMALSIPTPMVLVTWLKDGFETGVNVDVVCVPGNQTVAEESRNVGVDFVVRGLENSTESNASSTVAGTEPTSTSTAGAGRMGVGMKLSVFTVLVSGLLL